MALKKPPEHNANHDIDTGPHLSMPQQSFAEVYNKLRDFAEDNRIRVPSTKLVYTLFPKELDALMTGLSSLIEENHKLLELQKSQSPFDQTKMDALLLDLMHKGLRK